MTDSAPLVSILIRSMGREELSTALSSIQKQTYPSIEVIIVNASGQTHPPLPNPTPLKLNFIDSDSPLHRSVAANYLLDAASGKWALFLDDDDWISENHIFRLVNALNENANAHCAYSDVSCVEQDALSENGFREIKRFDSPYSPARLLVENYLPIHSVLFDLSLVKAAGIRFDPAFDLFEDWDFWLNFQRLSEFVHVPGVTAFYRIHSDSGEGVRTNNDEKAILALDQIIEKWRTKWSADQIRSLIGLARHVMPLQVALGEQDKIRSEMTKLTERIVAFENSRSWKVTKPLRDCMAIFKESKKNGGVNNLKINLSRWILKISTTLYKTPALSHLFRHIPAPVKRSIRNRLLFNSYASTAPISVGINLVRKFEKPPKVSILIPVFNHPDYIEQCIKSAIEQTWENLEIIVVDDASTDKKIKTLLHALEGLPRLKIIFHAENKGICHTQNTALLAATGEIIAFLDCDDYLAPNAISTSMAHWRDDTVYLHTGRINVDTKNNEINRINFVSLPRQDYFAENLQAMYATHLKMIRTDVFSRVGVFDPRFDSAQDYEILMRIAFHYPSSSFVHAPEFVYYHRLHAQQTTATQRTKQDKLTDIIKKEAKLRDAIRRGKYNKFISFVMLSYGKHLQTIKAIQGIKSTVKIPHEIILYDNGSTHETVQFLKEQVDGKFDGLHVFYGDRNLGPAQGRKKALEKASGDWIVVFDNDEIPEPGWIEELLLRAESYPNVGAVCCRVAFPDKSLQFSGGKVDFVDPENSPDLIDLALYDSRKPLTALETCLFRQVDWCPIGATLFTRNIEPYLHDGYPNTFEDAGVSFALKKEGLILLNAPGALVWHDHITFQPKAEMREQYMKDRYNPTMMLKSVASFYKENGLFIRDEYIWRENGLFSLSKDALISKLEDTLKIETRF